MHQRIIKKRHIFYLSGFDPRGARYYYNLYKQQSLSQCKIDGTKVHISPRKRLTEHSVGWTIDSNSNNKDTRTYYEFLEWNDIIRNHWETNIFLLLGETFSFFFHYLFNGVLFITGKTSPRQLITILYPAIYILFSYLLAVILFTITVMTLQDTLSLWINLIIGGTLTYLFLKLSEYIAKRIGVFWLLHIYTFANNYAKNKTIAMEKRLQFFSDRVINIMKDAEDNGINEVLFVSHSVGTFLGVSILNNAINNKNIPRQSWDVFSNLTLGECIPLVSYHKQAKYFRNEMQSLISHQNITWIDYTSPSDGACFPLVDFIQTSGIQTAKQKNPIFLSPRFHTLFTEKSYKKIRKDWQKAHFLYLLATEVSTGYNYFHITSGNKSLFNRIQKKENA